MNFLIPPLNDAEACIAFAHKINSKKQPLTIEKLRTFPGCEHYSDEEATEILKAFDQLTAIIFEATAQKQTTCCSDRQFVNLEGNNQPPPSPELNRKAA